MNQIITILKNHLGVDVQVNDKFEDLGVDYIDTVELLMLIERELDIDIPASKSFNTIEDLIQCVEKLIEKHKKIQST